MSSQVFLEKLRHVLSKRGLLSKYEGVLPDADFIKTVIFLVNSGKTKAASKKIDRLEEVLRLCASDLAIEERIHFNEVVEQVRNAINKFKSDKDLP